MTRKQRFFSLATLYVKITSPIQMSIGDGELKPSTVATIFGDYFDSAPFKPPRISVRFEKVVRKNCRQWDSMSRPLALGASTLSLVEKTDNIVATALHSFTSRHS